VVLEAPVPLAPVPAVSTTTFPPQAASMAKSNRSMPPEG
jgi:hypothetical protein